MAMPQRGGWGEPGEAPRGVTRVPRGRHIYTSKHVGRCWGSSDRLEIVAVADKVDMHNSKTA